jgi:monoamine oxidase
VGRIHWAGNDSGDQDFMEGAVTSGQRAAREIAKVLKR